tara:strand:+ start:70460 stop:70987 length:528 start_codon:yes stop_codon:yes gene_type:complete
MPLTQRLFARSLFLIALGAPIASASSDESVLACAKLATASERLSCYDEIAASLGVGSVRSSEPEDSQHINVRPTEALVGTAIATEPKEAEDNFGKEHWNSERDVEQVQARIATVQKDAYGKLVVKLDNEQVWRQVNDERIRLAEDDQVTIERGLLNSFVFRLQDSNREIKFSRVK